MPINERITRLGGNHHHELFTDTYKNAKAKPVKPGEKQITRLGSAWETVKVKLRRVWYDRSYGWVNNKKQLSELNNSMKIIVTQAKKENENNKLTINELHADFYVLTNAVTQAKEIITVLKGANANKKDLKDADVNFRALEVELNAIKDKKVAAEKAEKAAQAAEREHKETKKAKNDAVKQQPIATEQLEVKKVNTEPENTLPKMAPVAISLASQPLKQKEKVEDKPTTPARPLVSKTISKDVVIVDIDPAHHASRVKLREALKDNSKMSPLNFVSFEVRVSPYRAILDAVYDEAVKKYSSDVNIALSPADRDNCKDKFNNLQFHVQQFLPYAEDRREWAHLIKDLKAKIALKKPIADYNDRELRILMDCVNICMSDWKEIYKPSEKERSS